jgi:addiction module HigA family antidote
MDRSPPRAPHPGKVLLEHFLEAAGISQNELSRMMDVPARRVNEIVLGKRAITADTAVRLSEALGLSPEYWMSLQAKYDIDRAQAARTGKYARPTRPPEWMISVPLYDEGDLEKGG